MRSINACTNHTTLLGNLPLKLISPLLLLERQQDLGDILGPITRKTADCQFHVTIQRWRKEGVEEGGRRNKKEGGGLDLHDNILFLR